VSEVEAGVPPAAYAARFRRIRPALMIAAGGAVPVTSAEQIRELDAGPSPARLETAVSAHTEVRGWACHHHRLRTAVRAHAPGVPVLGFTADSHYDLAGWRADQERLRAIVEDAELRRSGW
jgi:hypothetical protein